MRSAPAVSYPVGRSSMRTALLWLPWLAGGLACAAWSWPSDRLSVAQGLALLLWLLAAVVIWSEWRRPVRGVLRWDGERWNWESAGRSECGSVQARLDWQRGLLLEFRAWQGQQRWLWPERQMAPLYWDALRRALYAPAPAAAGPEPADSAGGGS